MLLAKKQNKPIILFLQKKDCKTSKKMFNITFYNQNYIKQINKDYICIIVTYESKISYPIELFYTLDFPTMFFVNSKDESYLIKPLFGFVSPKKLSEILAGLTNRSF